MTNPNDAIRMKMLRYFYERNDASTSRFGKKGSAVKISDVKRQLREAHGLSQKEVQSNLTYLIDRGWVKGLDQEKTVTTRGGTTVPSVVTFYEITADGIDRIEGGSEFEGQERYPGIRIDATGHNVITLGDGNVVNADYQQLFDDLSVLKDAISSQNRLSEEEKLDVSIDIETLKDQLGKAEPDPEVVRRLWPRIDKAANLAGLAQAAIQLGELVGHLI